MSGRVPAPVLRSVGTQTIETRLGGVVEPEEPLDSEADSAGEDPRDPGEGAAAAAPPSPGPPGARRVEARDVALIPPGSRFYTVWVIEGRAWSGICIAPPPSPWRRLERLLPNGRYHARTCSLVRAGSLDEAIQVYSQEPGYAHFFPTVWLLE